MLSTHEYLMLMHIHGQIEKTSPVFSQQMILVSAFRKALQQLVRSFDPWKFAGDCTRSQVMRLEPFG